MVVGVVGNRHAFADVRALALVAVGGISDAHRGIAVARAGEDAVADAVVVVAPADLKVALMGEDVHGVMVVQVGGSFDVPHLAPSASRVGIADVAATGEVAVIVLLIHAERETNRPEAVPAAHRTSLLAGLGQGRKQYGRQDRYHRHDDQQLDNGKSESHSSHSAPSRSVSDTRYLSRALIGAMRVLYSDGGAQAREKRDSRESRRPAYARPARWRASSRSSGVVILMLS